jgi:cell division protease FtsH
MAARPGPRADPPTQPRSKPPYDWRAFAWLAAIFAVFWFWSASYDETPPQTLTYTAFKQEVRAGDVERVTLRGDQVTGTLKMPPSAAAESSGKALTPKQFTTTLPPIDDPKLLELLDSHGVEVQAESEQISWWWRLAIGVLPWVLIIGVFWYASAKMRERMASGGSGGIFGFGKSRAKRFVVRDLKVTFDDVAGLENAKRDLAEIVGYLKDPARYRELGAKIPRGVLLMGAPGTGKTLLARAVAGEADVPFFSISASEFIEVFVGVGASRVRDMFESAKKEAPAIIFVDEIDSVGRARGAGVGGGHDEREQTLNQILSEMDGFAPHEAVVVLAATNRPDVLDSALLRPGRFDRKVTLDLPDRRARRAILAIHARHVPLADDVDLDRLAALTVGLAGADLENLVNEAALLAARDGARQVTMAAFLNARDKAVFGGKREFMVSAEEKKLTAYHEAGHALVASLLPAADPLDKVTIIPRGRALGATEQIPDQDRHHLRESYLDARITVMLAGRAAEQIVFGETSSGAEEDLKQATRLARHMVAQWGMSERLGPVAFRRGEEHIFLGRELAQQRDYSESTAEIIDEEVARRVGRLGAAAADILRRHRAELEAVANALLTNETLDREAIENVLAAATPARQRVLSLGGASGREAR